MINYTYNIDFRMLITNIIHIIIKVALVIIISEIIILSLICFRDPQR